MHASMHHDFMCVGIADVSSQNRRGVAKQGLELMLRSRDMRHAAKKRLLMQAHLMLRRMDML